MKVTLMFLIICFLAVMGFFLIGKGCYPVPSSVPNSEKQPPPPETAPQRTLDMREMRRLADSEKEPLEALDEKEPLEGFMTPLSSQKWLANNHYQVQKQADGNGYIITRSSDNSRFVISIGHVRKAFMTTDKNVDSSTGEVRTTHIVGDGSTGEVIREVLMTTDRNGEIRVKVNGAQ